MLAPIDQIPVTSTITPQLITARITAFLWRVEQGDTLISSGSTNDLLLAQKESHDIMSSYQMRGTEPCETGNQTPFWVEPSPTPMPLCPSIAL